MQITPDYLRSCRMACKCGGVAVIEGTSPILDVHDIIQNWAWHHYLKKVGRFRKHFLRREDFEVDVPMNYYQFEDSETTFEDVTADPTVRFKHKSTPETNVSKTEVVNPNTSILSTKYVNDTNKDQVYKFRMERERKASLNVTYQRGFSVEGKAKFTVGNAGGEINTKLEITKTTGESFEQTLTFETNSDINVEKKSNCTARVFFSEREIRKMFTVKTTMSMPSRSAPVFIRRKKDKKLFALLQLTDLAYVFDPFEKHNDVKYIKDKFPIDDWNPEKGNYITHNVQFTTTGIIEGMRLSGQTVRLQTVEITEKNKSNTLNEDLTEHENYHYGIDEKTENTVTAMK